VAAATYFFGAAAKRFLERSLEKDRTVNGTSTSSVRLPIVS
jgi:hypothetical protein